MDLINKIKKYDSEEFRYEDYRMVLRGINTMKEMLEFAETVRHRKTLLSDMIEEEK